jgi:hypothetical protein
MIIVHTLTRQRLIAWVISIALLLSLAIPLLRADGDQVAMMQKELQLQLGSSTSGKRVAQYLLNSKPNSYTNRASIITQNEWDELKLDNLVDKICKPETSFGATGLRWLFWPVSNLQEIQRRQTMVKTLVADEKLYNDLQKVLKDIKQGERALLSYWAEDIKTALANKQNQTEQNDHDPMKNFLCHSKIFNDLPFVGPWIDKMLNKALNHSSLALDVSVHDRVYDVVKAALLSLFFWRAFVYCKYRADCFIFEKDIRETEYGKKHHVTGDFKEDLWKETKEGALAPLNLINPYPHILCNKQIPNEEDLIEAFNQGSLGDKILSIYLWKKKDDARLTGWRKVVNNVYVVPKMVEIILRNVSQSGLYYGGAVWWAYTSLKKLWDQLKDSQESLVSIAHFVRALPTFEKMIDRIPELRDSAMKEHVSHVMNKKNWSDDFKELMSLLQSSTFDSKDSLLVSRGKMVRAHFLLKKVKHELIPALQAIAEFDAYFALAKLYKEHQGKKNSFVFAQFINQATPKFALPACWEPLVATPQQNDLYFGEKGVPIRMLITGPNGGGKSTVLKSFAHAIIMAQGWGIIPAKSAQMTITHGLRTSLDPREDISKGLSTFMAQKKRIGELGEFLKKSSSTNKTVVILDEPYRGTVDDETADRIYTFGKQAVNVPHATLMVATHVKKPLQLAQETKGGFANYQIGIQEQGQGRFTRTFKLLPGAAQWWFNDAGRRSRFVDWLDTELQRNIQLQSAAAA